MVTRASKRRAANSSIDAGVESLSKIFLEDPSAPATPDTRRKWKGFCEIESEPAFFNVMLDKFGVRGVKVQEVVSLDDEILMFLPRPIYGLIFLFRWMEEDPDRQEQSCPEEVWFANQTVNNACASVALLNIVNNIPEIELGDHLRNFKEFTMSFSPALRGDAISNFEFVKEIHNSFARKMDMLNADLLLKNEATLTSKGRKRKADEGENEAGFHFIAFLPIAGKLWKLDGLERQPMCLGPTNDDWLNEAKPDIEARMAQYEGDQIEFAILSLVREPLPGLIDSLADNATSIAALSSRLDAIKPDWREFITFASNGEIFEGDGVLTTAEAAYGLTQERLDKSKVLESVTSLVETGIASDVIQQWQKLVTAQADLRMSIREEQQSKQSDQDKATARRCDFGSRMQNFARKVKAREMSSAAA